jgi:hypothetical protein
MLTNLEFGKWQPMESAPKDGEILLLTEETTPTGKRRRVEMGRCNDDRHARKPKPFWEQISRRHLGLVFMRKNPPIAWMPLPSTEFEPSKQDDEEPHEHTEESRLRFHCEMAGNSADEDFALGELLDMSTAELQELSQSELEEVIRPAFDDWQGTQVSGGWEIE